MRGDRIRSKVLAVRVIPQADAGLIARLNLTMETLSLGLITCDSDDVGYTALDEATKRHTIEWKWVKGHAGHELNERADQLANEGMAPFKGRKGKADPLMPPV